MPHVRAHIVLHRVLLVLVLAINKPTGEFHLLLPTNKFYSIIQFGRVCGFVWPSCGFQEKWLVNKVLLLLFVLNGFFGRSFKRSTLLKQSFELARYNDTHTYIFP